jgi:hypothetical protein
VDAAVEIEENGIIPLLPAVHAGAKRLVPVFDVNCI